jgi:glycosyltransferase involved in cell wall biosynthesis
VRLIKANMRVLFVCGFAWEPKGTVSARAFPLAAELVKRGYEVTLLLTPYDNPSESGQKREFHGVRIVNVEVGEDLGLRQIPFTVKRLCTAIREYSADIVHIFKPKGYAGAACTWLFMSGFRSVVLDCDDWEGWGGWNDVKNYPWIVKEYIDRQEKWLMRRAPVVTTASRTLEHRAVKMRESPNGVFYIPNCGGSPDNVAAQEKALSMTGEQAKKSFGLPEAPVIFYSGHFEVRHEIMFFCRAATLAARRFGATIVIVGDGPERPHMKEFFARQEGVRVRFFPRLPYDQFVALIAASDIAAFPYPDGPIYQAKCSARIIDYMSMGKAIVSTSVGENNEYICNGDSGILTRPGEETEFAEELERLLADTEFRVQLGRKARQRVKEKFLWSGEPVETCLKAYQQLTEG